MRRFIILLMTTFWFCLAFSEELSDLEKRMVARKFTSDIDFKEIPLSDVLSTISSATKTTLVADESAKKVPIDLYIVRGKSLKDVVDLLKVTYNLKVKVVEEVVVFTRGNSNGVGNSPFIGKVTALGYEDGLQGVKVTVMNSGLSPVTTTYGGLFIVENLNPGIYIVKAELPGYKVEGELIEMKGSERNFINIAMEKKYEVKDNKLENTEPDENKKLLGQIRESDGGEYLSERITLKHAFPEDVKGLVESTIGEIEVTAFDKLNMIIVKGTPSNLSTAKKLIEDIDKPLKQVRITAQILDVTDNLFENLGFDWAYDSNGTKSTSGGVVGGLDTANTIGIGTSYSTTVDLVTSIGGGDDLLNVAINMLQSTQDLAISAVPSIVIVNGEEAEFKITDEVIVGQEEIEEDNDITKTIPLFEEAGIIFRVKPTIRDGGDNEDTILLVIDTEVSNFNLRDVGDKDVENGGTFNEDGGSKSIRNIRTKVSVKSGDSLFIGGLKKAEVTNIVSKIPLLGDIPGIGFAFRKEGVSNQMRDIFIKIRAEIVTDDNLETDIDLKGFKDTELHRMERDIKDHRRIYPKISEQPQLLGTPNIFDK